MSAIHAFGVACGEKDVEGEVFGEIEEEQKAHFEKLRGDVLEDGENTGLGSFFFWRLWNGKKIHYRANDENSDRNEENVQLHDSIFANGQVAAKNVSDNSGKAADKSHTLHHLRLFFFVEAFHQIAVHGDLKSPEKQIVDEDS